MPHYNGKELVKHPRHPRRKQRHVLRGRGRHANGPASKKPRTQIHKRARTDLNPKQVAICDVNTGKEQVRLRRHNKTIIQTLVGRVAHQLVVNLSVFLVVTYSKQLLLRTTRQAAPRSHLLEVASRSVRDLVAPPGPEPDQTELRPAPRQRV